MNPALNTPEERLLTLLPLSDNGAELLQKDVRILQINQGDIPIHKGEKISGAYIVIQGALRVFSYTPNGGESSFYQIQPGETCVFAVNCLFNKLLYPAWVVAEQNSQVAVIDGSVFKQLFQCEGSIQNLTISALSSAVFKLMTQVEQLQGWNLTQRLVNLILSLSNDDNRIEMTQQLLAERLGSSREVIARLLKNLADQKLITTGRGEIKLLNTNKLSEMLKP